MRVYKLPDNAPPIFDAHTISLAGIYAWVHAQPPGSIVGVRHSAGGCLVARYLKQRVAAWWPEQPLRVAVTSRSAEIWLPPPGSGDDCTWELLVVWVEIFFARFNATDPTIVNLVVEFDRGSDGPEDATREQVLALFARLVPAQVAQWEAAISST